MKLSKEEEALFLSNRPAFLVKVYLTIDPTPTIRECAKAVGLSPSYCGELMASLGWQSPRAKGQKTDKRADKLADTQSVCTSAIERGVADKRADKLADKKRTKPPSDLTLYKQVFEERYRSLTGLDFYWEPKHIKALKELVEQKIAFGMKSKGNTPTTESLCINLGTFLSLISDPWILSNYTPSIINSKYSEIIATHNAKRTTPTTERGRKERDLQDFRSALADKRQEYGL